MVRLGRVLKRVVSWEDDSVEEADRREAVQLLAAWNAHELGQHPDILFMFILHFLLYFGQTYETPSFGPLVDTFGPAIVFCERQVKRVQRRLGINADLECDCHL